MIHEDIRVKELKNLEYVGADRGFIPPSVRFFNIYIIRYAYFYVNDGLF